MLRYGLGSKSKPCQTTQNHKAPNRTILNNEENGKTFLASFNIFLMIERNKEKERKDVKDVKE